MAHFMNLLAVIVATVLAFAVVPAHAADSDSVVAYFARSQDFNSTFETFGLAYSKALDFPGTNSPAVSRAADMGGSALALQYTNTNVELMRQLVEKVKTDPNWLIQKILDNRDLGYINIKSLRVVPKDVPTPAPSEEQSFIAKYPYIIAAIAVALLIGIIIGAVVLIQKRANHLAEMEDESMLAEGEGAGGFASGARGENDAVVITQGSRVINNGNQQNAAAGRGRGGRGGAAGGRGRGAPLPPKVVKSAGETDEGQQQQQQSAYEAPAAVAIADPAPAELQVQQEEEQQQKESAADTAAVEVAPAAEEEQQ